MDPALNKDDFNRYVDRHDHQHAEMDSRIARDTVPLSMYAADQRATERRFTELERDIDDIRKSRASAESVSNLTGRVDALEKRPANLRTYLLALASLALTLLGILVSAYFAMRSGH